MPKWEDKYLNDLKLSNIDIRPEAPWIKRTSDFNLVFTDEVLPH